MIILHSLKVFRFSILHTDLKLICTTVELWHLFRIRLILITIKIQKCNVWFNGAAMPGFYHWGEKSWKHLQMYFQFNSFWRNFSKLPKKKIFSNWSNYCNFQDLYRFHEILRRVSLLHSFCKAFLQNQFIIICLTFVCKFHVKIWLNVD